MKSLMSLRHAWSVVDQSVSKIKILKKEKEQISMMIHCGECILEEAQNKTNQEMKNPKGIENHKISIDMSIREDCGIEIR